MATRPTQELRKCTEKLVPAAHSREHVCERMVALNQLNFVVKALSMMRQRHLHDGQKDATHRLEKSCVRAGSLPTNAVKWKRIVLRHNPRGAMTSAATEPPRVETLPPQGRLYGQPSGRNANA